jgi:aspartyl-tRNA(Asn)/glutamyl-tRNA(Gln) amidotransferase subunit B
MQRAIEFEIERQIELIESGGRVTQETRLWDEKAAATRVMRSKEEAHDYRYFPDPDLPPLIVAQDFVDTVRNSLPELPDVRRDRYMYIYGLSFGDASQLVSSRALGDFFEIAAKTANNPRGASNWIRSDLLRELESRGQTVGECKVAPEELGALIRLIDEGTISGKQAKEIFVEMCDSGKSASVVVEERGLVQVSDVGQIDSVIDEVIAFSSKQLEQYRAGKETLFGYFVGQVMKATKGQANPKIVNERLIAKLRGSE